MERVMGIEPTFEAWEAPVLPLNYTREMVAIHGLYWCSPGSVIIFADEMW